MYNPLLPDLSTLKDADVENKIAELSRKYHIAARAGMNDVLPQILVALEAYREELVKRSAQALKNSIKNSNNNLDDLINVD
jgi:hypothetical protein